MRVIDSGMNGIEWFGFPFTFNEIFNVYLNNIILIREGGRSKTNKKIYKNSLKIIFMCFPSLFSFQCYVMIFGLYQRTRWHWLEDQLYWIVHPRVVYQSHRYYGVRMANIWIWVEKGKFFASWMLFTLVSFFCVGVPSPVLNFPSFV